MGDPVVELEPVTLAVEPGGQARVVVTVFNDGSIVEGYRVEVLDDLADTGRDVAGPATWSEVIPAEGTRAADSGGEPDLSVYPGQQGTVIVVFSPPVGTRAPGGRCAFAVRVSSVVDPETSTVVEGDLDVGKVTALQAKLVPVTSTGRWSGKHLVELSNWGNTAAHLRVVADDPDRALGFLVNPETVDLPVGASAPVRLKVRTRKPQLRGTPARLPFTVRAEPVGGVPTPQVDLPQVTALPGEIAPQTATVDGAFNQKPILTIGVVLGAGLLLAGVAGLTAYGLMQRGDRPPTYEELGVPGTPQVWVEATGPDSLRVSWVPVDQVEGYRLFQLDEQGVVSGEPLALAPEAGATPVNGLEPDREYCFTMAAVRGEIQSPPSPPGCATTEKAVVAATTEEPTEDATTEEETTAANETTDAELTDAAAEEPTDEAPGEGADGPPTDGPGETPPAAPPQPAPAPPPQPQPPPVPPVDAPLFRPGEWAALLGVFPGQGSAGEFGAIQLAEALEDVGVEAHAVNSAEFPDLGFVQDGWLVVLGGFDSFDEAALGCPAVQAIAPDLVTFCNPPVQPIRL